MVGKESGWIGRERKGKSGKANKVYYVDVQNTLNIREKNDVFKQLYIFPL